jgi:DNA-binding transcriptional LysR family regulator
MLNYNKLRYFYEVSKYLNITKAAEALFLSQPALSRHISDLEAEFGAKLFIRTNRDLALTDMGEALSEECLKLFSSEADITNRLRSFSDVRRGNLRVALYGTEISYRIQPLIRRFKEQYPLIELRQERLNLNAAEESINSCKSDIGVVVSMAGMHCVSLMRHSLAQSQISAILTPSHPLAGEQSIDMHQLAGERMLVQPRKETHLQYSVVTKLSSEAGFKPDISEEYPNTETIMMMVQAGAGITILSSLAPLSMFPDLVCIPINGSPIVSCDLAWNPGNDNFAIELFVKLAKEAEW